MQLMECLFQKPRLPEPGSWSFFWPNSNSLKRGKCIGTFNMSKTKLVRFHHYRAGPHHDERCYYKKKNLSSKFTADIKWKAYIRCISPFPVSLEILRKWMVPCTWLFLLCYIFTRARQNQWSTPGIFGLEMAFLPFQTLLKFKSAYKNLVAD